MKTNIADSIIGISIEENTVSVCVIQNGQVIKTGSAEAEAGQIPLAVRKLTENAGVKKCVIVIPPYSVKTVFEPLRKSSKLKHDKLLLNIPSEFKNFLSASEAGKYIYDYRAEQTDENNTLMDIIPVAVKKTDILRLEQHAKNAGLQPVSVVTKEECCARILDAIKGDRHNEHSCFINIAEKTLEIRFFKGHLPVLTFVEDINLDTPYDEMAKLVARAADQFLEKSGADAKITAFITGEYAMDRGFEKAITEHFDKLNITKISEILNLPGNPENIDINAILIGACLKNGAGGRNPLVHQMNLYIGEKKTNVSPMKIMIPVIIILALVLFGWIGFYNPLMEKNSMENQLKESQTQLKEAKKKAESFADIKSEYVQYYRDYETEDEAGTLDRTSCMNIIKNYVFPYVTVTDAAMKGNELTIKAENASMKTISKLINELNELDFVEYATPVKSSSDDETDEMDDTLAASTQFTIVLNPSEKVLERGIGTGGNEK